MHTRIIVAFLLSFSLGVAARGRWDGATRRVAGINVASGQASVAVRSTPDPGDTVAPYLRVSCPGIIARIGVGFSDAGCTVQSDAGQPCDIVRGDLGEKFYAQLGMFQTHVVGQAQDGGALVCDIHQSVE